MKKKTDAEIREAVLHELQTDIRVAEPGVNPASSDGGGVQASLAFCSSLNTRVSGPQPVRVWMS